MTIDSDARDQTSQQWEMQGSGLPWSARKLDVTPKSTTIAGGDWVRAPIGGDIDLLRDSEGRLVLHLLPIMHKEAAFADENSPAELCEIWKESRTDLLDINRGSVL